MDFTRPPDVERFRNELRAWLARNQPSREARYVLAGDDDAARVEFLKAWQRSLFEAGFVAVHWPADVGGRGLTLLHHIAANEELVRADAPPLINGPSLSISGPTLLACGSAAQRRRYLPKLLTAEEVWCLGFSEPGAGSDLASLRTRAQPSGDDFVLNGQKVWTTYGHMADFGLFLVRTDPDAPKHKGISCLIVPMRSPGLTVRPLREMTGDHDFNEVFLEDVRVPKENLVGRLNEGWQVILTALGHERGTLLVVDRVRLRRVVERAIAALHDEPERARDASIRQKLAQLWVESEIQGLHAIRILADLEQHRPPTESSILKLFGSEVMQRAGEFGLALQGPYGLLYGGSKHVRDEGSWQHTHLMNFSLTIASGTSEVQRNIIAQRLLGLPAA
ncbi:MAG: acyl-CoA dehydrogenase family protein [Thermodesulfobacteriota bacterium]